MIPAGGKPSPVLLVLHREIESRTRETAASHPDWPCRKGCDACCRSLAEPPRLTRPEWEFLEQGLAALPPDVQRGIAANVQALRDGSAPRSVCPFLDREASACRVYEHRPPACRTYGFYVERDRGLYCRQIENQVDSGGMEDVVWGNAAAVEARLSELGEKIGLLDWFAARISDSPESSLRPLPTPPSALPDPYAAR